MRTARAALALALLPAAAFAHDPVQRNEIGFPVRDPDGTRHTYTQAELAQYTPLVMCSREEETGSQQVSLGAGGTRLWSYVSWGQGVGLSRIRTVATSQGLE